MKITSWEASEPNLAFICFSHRINNTLNHKSRWDCFDLPVTKAGAVTLASSVQVINNNKKKNVIKHKSWKYSMFAILQWYTQTVSKSGRAFALNITEGMTVLCNSHESVVKWNDWLVTLFFLLTSNWCHEQLHTSWVKKHNQIHNRT